MATQRELHADAVLFGCNADEFMQPVAVGIGQRIFAKRSQREPGRAVERRFRQMFAVLLFGRFELTGRNESQRQPFARGAVLAQRQELGEYRDRRCKLLVLDERLAPVRQKFEAVGAEPARVAERIDRALPLTERVVDHSEDVPRQRILRTRRDRALRMDRGLSEVAASKLGEGQQPIGFTTMIAAGYARSKQDFRRPEVAGTQGIDG